MNQSTLSLSHLINTDAVDLVTMEKIYEFLTFELNIHPQVLIDNAALLIAEQARRMLGGRVANRSIVILAGPGGNGADAIATARRLIGWHAQATVLLASTREALGPHAREQLELAEQFGVRIFEPDALLPQAELVIDGLVGTGLHGGGPEGTVGQLVDAALRYRAPILSIDVPTGLSALTGKADAPVIRATATVTLGYPKVGLVKPFAHNLVGELSIGDIGIPPSLWHRFNLAPPDFSGGALLTLPVPQRAVV